MSDTTTTTAATLATHQEEWRNHITQMVWPHCFLKKQRTSTLGNPLWDYFIATGMYDEAVRYSMDFMDHPEKRQWYQFDTDQDAGYFGAWFNPVTLQAVSFTEGDIHIVDCPDVAAFRAELQASITWNAERMDMSSDEWLDMPGCGIDDHDGLFEAHPAAHAG